MKRLWYSNVLFYLLVLLIILIAGVAGAKLGLAEREDSVNILVTFPRILAGGYQRSRTSGFPLYEISSAWIFHYFGLTVVNLVSTFYMLLYGLTMIFLARRVIADEARRKLAAFALLLNPLILTNASAMMETSLWMALFALSTFFLFRATDREANPRDLLLSQGFAALMVLTRPDSALSALSAVLALFLDRGLAFARRRIAIVACLAGLFSASVYLLLNRDLGFLDSSILLHNPLSRRVLQAVLSTLNVVGIPGALTLLLATLSDLFGRRLPPLVAPAREKTDQFLDRLLVLNILFVAPRFVALPDQPDYLLIPASLFWLWCAARLRSPAISLLLSASAVFPSLFTISLLARCADGVRPALGLNEGAVYQDWDLRRFRMLRGSSAFRTWVARSIYGEDTKVELLDIPFFPGLVTSRNPADHPDLVIDARSRYVIDNPRFQNWYYHSNNFNRIWVCDEDLFARRGWPLLQPPMSFDVATGFMHNGKLTCYLDAQERNSRDDHSDSGPDVRLR